MRLSFSLQFQPAISVPMLTASEADQTAIKHNLMRKKGPQHFPAAI
jgi:hypothetical protein